MKKTILLNIILFCLCAILAGCSVIKVEIKVTDEHGTAIEGANVYIGRDGYGGIASKGKAVKGTSDLSGKFSSLMINHNGYLYYGATKAGYYPTRLEAHGLSNGTNFTIILRQIIDPIPMYAVNAQLVVPANNKDVGYDLIERDFIAPYGKGKYEDLIFNVKSRIGGRHDYDGLLTVKCLPENGIMENIEELPFGKPHLGSEFKMPRLAPETGYKNAVELYVKGTEIARTSSFDRNKNYIFKTRSNLDKSMFGKIRGDISFSLLKDGNANIHFIYYLNPNWSRNLEFDPKQNLFKNLSRDEVVLSP